VECLPEIWRIRAQPNQNWTQRAWLHVALRSPPDFQGRICLPRKQDYSAYQSECSDQSPHLRHWVEVQRWRQAGQTPPVSNVFQRWPQVQDHMSSLRGDQSQSGQRMRGPEGSRLFSCSSSGSTMTDDLSFERAHMPLIMTQFGSTATNRTGERWFLVGLIP
jgi:hypothetical protein